MDLSIIIVNYNTKDLLSACLKSVYASKTKYSFEVFVSDNGSKDDSLQMLKRDFPQAIAIANNANLGFSKGNNIAIRKSSADYVLLLNSDTTVEPDTLELSLDYLKAHPKIGALGCKVVLPTGKLDKACRRNFPNPWNSFLRLFGFRRFSTYNIERPVDEVMEVDAVMGAYMMVPKNVIDRVGLLSEDYFMYGEDLDWCWRIKAAGFKIIYYPKAKINHFKYGSSKLVPFRTIKLAHRAMKIFYRKHYSAEYPTPFNWLVFLGIDLRMYLVLIVNLFRRNKTVH